MNFQLSYLFTDHMILQRDKKIAVFGTGSDGTNLSVSLLDSSSNPILSPCGVTMQATGRMKDETFLLFLPPHPAGGPYTLLATDGTDTLRFSDVYFGDLWLAGGQSNMEFPLQNSDEFKSVSAEVRKFYDEASCPVRYDLIRHYFVPHLSFVDENTEQTRRTSSWQLCTPENIPYWSAVAFFFARRLVQDVSVPIGIINCNWGGTSASAWLDYETLMADRDTAEYHERYKKQTEGLSMEKYLADIDTYKIEIQEWDRRKNEVYAKNPDADWNEVITICGNCPWPGPMGPRSEFRPCGLYETMLKTVVPYTLKGFLYYQGESDEGYADHYDKLMRAVIETWRRDFLDDSLPFLFVQLPMFKNKSDPDSTTWANLRNAQWKVYRSVKHTGIAVALDLGKFNDIHPTHKQACGERLALQALYQVYNIKNPEEAFGPVFRYAIPDKNRLKLYFDYAAEGFLIDYRAVNYTPVDTVLEKPTPALDCDAQHIRGFELLGEDGIWYSATATPFYENGTYGFLLSATKVAQPVHARYAWINWAPVTVFGINGLPLAPFCC